MPNKDIQFDPVGSDTIDFAPISFEPIEYADNYQERDSSLISKYADFSRNFVEGGAKEAERGVRSLGKLGDFVLKNTVGRGINILQGKGNVATQSPDIYNDKSQASVDFLDRTTPEGTGQKLGAFGMKVAEFLIGDKLTKPLAAAAKAAPVLKTLATKAPKVAKGVQLGIESLTQGLTGGGVTALQTGEVGKEAKTNAFISALIPVAAEGMKTLSTRINKFAIKAGKKDIEDGFSYDTINKYKLGGNLQKMATKTGDEIKKTAEELKDVLKSSDETIDLNSAYYKTYEKMKEGKFRLFGENKAVDRALSNLADELDNVKGANDGVNLYEANLIKQGAGAKGSWVYGKVDPDAVANEKVYSKFYSVLKEEIEKADGSDVVQSLNKKLGELIPVQNAILRRIPVAERQAVIGLQDSMYLFGALLDPRSLFLNLGTIATKSPTFANWLYKAATGGLKGIPSATIKADVSSSDNGDLPGIPGL